MCGVLVVLVLPGHKATCVRRVIVKITNRHRPQPRQRRQPRQRPQTRQRPQPRQRKKPRQRSQPGQMTSIFSLKPNTHVTSSTTSFFALVCGVLVALVLPGHKTRVNRKSAKTSTKTKKHTSRRRPQQRHTHTQRGRRQIQDKSKTKTTTKRLDEE